MLASPVIRRAAPKTSCVGPTGPFPAPGMRDLSFLGFRYTIFYRTQEEGRTIWRVLPQSRDVPAHLGLRREDSDRTDFG